MWTWTIQNLGGVLCRFTYTGGIRSLESIPGLHKRLKIRALGMTHEYLPTVCCMFPCLFYIFKQTSNLNVICLFTCPFLQAIRITEFLYIRTLTQPFYLCGRKVSHWAAFA
jgi:hypothetical protein